MARCSHPSIMRPDQARSASRVAATPRRDSVRRADGNFIPATHRLARGHDRHRQDAAVARGAARVPDPYRVWLSEVMLQQTTVKTVAPYYRRFLARWGDVGALASAPLEEVLRTWAGLGYYAGRAICMLARAPWSSSRRKIAASEAALRALPGIGDYTAAAIADRIRCAGGPGGRQCRARDRAAFRRRGAASLAQAGAAPPCARTDTGRAAPATSPGHDGPRGDHLHAEEAGLLPVPWNDSCAAQARGDARHFPPYAEAGRRVAPRRGLRRPPASGFSLVRTRPAHGLLGGMTEVPTTDSMQDLDDATALASAPWTSWQSPRTAGVAAPPGVVRHVFTNSARTSVYVARRQQTAAPPARAGLRLTRLMSWPCRALRARCWRTRRARKPPTSMKRSGRACRSSRADLRRTRARNVSITVKPCGVSPYQSRTRRWASSPCASAPILWIESTTSPANRAVGARPAPMPRRHRRDFMPGEETALIVRTRARARLACGDEGTQRRLGRGSAAANAPSSPRRRRRRADPDEAPAEPPRTAPWSQTAERSSTGRRTRRRQDERASSASGFCVGFSSRLRGP